MQGFVDGLIDTLVESVCMFVKALALWTRVVCGNGSRGSIAGFLFRSTGGFDMGCRESQKSAGRPDSNPKAGISDVSRYQYNRKDLTQESQT